MVRALLDGRKTQTRRVLSRSNVLVLGEKWTKKARWAGLRFGEAVARYSPVSGAPYSHLDVPFCHPADEPMPTGDCGVYRVRPVFETGDRLWVREALARFETHGALRATCHYPADHTAVAAPPGFDHDASGRAIWLWGPRGLPSIHMPRWASRLALTITDVRVQRLQQISEEDAIAEGVEHGSIICDGAEHLCWFGAPHVGDDSAIEAYATLWDSINNPRGYCADDEPKGWAANPWVVAIRFGVEKRNIDGAWPCEPA